MIKKTVAASGECGWGAMGKNRRELSGFRPMFYNFIGIGLLWYAFVKLINYRT